MKFFDSQPEQTCIIQIEGLSKTFQEGGRSRVVLSEANACIIQGEFVAILGKSGSGKSTLLNLISGIDLADSGAIKVNGIDLNQLDDSQRTIFRRKYIGFVFQFFNLIQTLTVIENIVLPAELNGYSPRQAREKAEYLLSEVGLSGRSSTYPDRLSGGEQQRVAIARALINDPLLLLADEPTGNLDEQNSRMVLSLLDRVTRQAGKMMVMVTHNQDAAMLSDRILYLRDGKLWANPGESSVSKIIS